MDSGRKYKASDETTNTHFLVLRVAGVFGLRRSPGVVKTGEHNVPEAGCSTVFRRGADTLLGSLGRANQNHSTAMSVYLWCVT
jgi:hypothetical protein